MCTVTFTPLQNGYFFTSNRDEKNTRSIAKPPQIYTYGNFKIIFPKDEDANGTWIVLKQNGNALCLLNGAFENFTSTNNYKKSRGIVVLELASAINSLDAFSFYSFNMIAPFTLIVIHKNNLYECRWDAKSKFVKQLNFSKHYIWSSATLYTKEQMLLREIWFKNFIKYKNNPTQTELIDFHKNTGDGNSNNNLVMAKDEKYITVSITSIMVNDFNKQMVHHNLLSDQQYCKAFEKDLQIG